MPKQIFVNITQAEAAKVTRRTVDGREQIVVSSATLPFGVVMNEVRYPKDEILNSYKGLENKLAPIGHPVVDGKHVSAVHPRAIVEYHAGIHNENVRVEDGKIRLDKVIDVEACQKHPRGVELLNRLKEGKPIHTSTGLRCNLRQSNSADAKFDAFNMQWDHDAILMDEPGAATPDQGVGMMVNSDGSEIEVVNISLEDYDYEMVELADRMLEVMDQRERQEQRRGRIGELMGRLFGNQRGDKDYEDDKRNQEKEDDMPMSEDERNALIEGVANSVMTKFEAKIDAVNKTLTEITNSLKATENAERAELVNAAVAAGKLTQEDADGTPTKVLKILMNAEQKPAAAAARGPLDQTNAEKPSTNPLKTITGGK